MNVLNAGLTAAALASVFSLTPSPASASLILAGPENFQGTGLGAVNTILTIQSPGNSSTEAGAVSYNGSADVITGDAKTGASQTLTRSIGDLGLTTAANLRVVFNALEPGNAATNGITLEDLVLNIYSPSGSVLFSSGDFQSQIFADTQTGAGNSGFVFRLDAAQAAAAQAAFNSTDNRIGLSASASNATGGFETFFVANTGGPGGGPNPGPVPEPASLALFGAGLLGLGLVRRRKAGG